MSTERIGTTIGGYRIESILGRGGMSVVYLAEHEGLERKAALKVLSPELAEDPAFRQRFVAEWKTLAALDHPNIIPIFEAGEADGALFIAMRYVQTTDLKALIRAEGGRLDPGRAISIIAQAASALDAAHARSLVHRDVKPANILVAIAAGAEGVDHAYLSDFGLTKHTDVTSGITKTGMFMGTVDYIAPEQVGGKHVDGRADQYALACVLFECLTGQVPFRREEETAALFAHLSDPPPALTELRPDLPPAIDEVIARAMAKEPDERFGTCTELVRTARAALGLGQTAPSGVSVVPPEQPTLPPTPSKVAPAPVAPPATPLAPTPPPPAAPGKPNRVPLIVGAVVAVVALGVLAFTQLGGGDEGEPVASGPTSPTGSVAGPTGSTAAPTGATAEPTGPATSGPSGAVLFADPFDDPSLGWEDSPQNGVQRELTPEGTYRFTWTDQAPIDAFAESSGGVGGVGQGAPDLTDVRVSVTATLVKAEGRHTFGVACRSREDGTYYLYMSSDGFWQIAMIYNVGSFESLNQGSDGEIAMALDTYEIAGTCVGGADGSPVTLTLFVDGREVATVVDDVDPPPPPDENGNIPPIPSGSVGIFAEGNTGTVIEFDDFSVEDLSA